MEINADFSRRVIVHSNRIDWQPSPMKGVDRRMLDRIGDEVARATTIVRYAPGSNFPAHTHTGGIIFVKLWQFDLSDRTQFRKDMAAELGAMVDGVATANLHTDDREAVTFHRLDAGATLTSTAPGGTEMLVIDGIVTAEGEVLGRNAWLRLPDGDTLAATAGAQGAALWMKTGHLRDPALPA
jgi:redox-sensitive bicupin YhaK (pirin superfamily)